MIGILKNLKKLRSFKPAVFEESTAALNNPSRGWFVLKNFNINEEPDFYNSNQKHDEENLVLVLIDIGACRDRALGQEEFCRMEKILDHYYDKGQEIILRVSYDSVGKGLEREPISFSQVHEHARQIAEFIAANREKIFVYQGLLVGSWGEMHSTKYAGSDRLAELNAVFEKTAAGTVYRAVRKPVQWRLLTREPGEGQEVVPGNLGLFNDGMFGSDTDLGTFDSSNKNNHAWIVPWNRERELAFISEVSKKVPFGGEALFGEGFAANHSLEEYTKELKKTHVTYLNKHHDNKLIEWFKRERIEEKGLWNSVSYYDYIGSHLGYRFVIREASMYRKKDGVYLEIIIENNGFAPVYSDTEMLLLCDDDGLDIAAGFAEKLNMCLPQESHVFRAKVEPKPGKYYISAKQIRGKRSVFFANTSVDEDGKIYLGKIVK